MEWLLVKNLSIGVIEYHLMDAGSKSAILKYNSHQQAVRIHAGDHYGIYFIERNGGFINKTVVKNEYGQEIGKLSFDKKNSHHGPIELDGRRYQYSFQNTPFAELLLYHFKEQANPLISTELKNENGQQEVVFTSVSNEEYVCLLLGLCWYCSQHLQMERVEPAPVLVNSKF